MGFKYWNPAFEIQTVDPALSNGEELDDGLYELSKTGLVSLSKRSITDTDTRHETFVTSMSTSAALGFKHSASNFIMPPANRTLFLECSDPKVDCFTVKCSGGPFLPNKTKAVINFQLRPDLKILGKS